MAGSMVSGILFYALSVTRQLHRTEKLARLFAKVLESIFRVATRNELPSSTSRSRGVPSDVRGADGCRSHGGIPPNVKNRVPALFL
jgi:hypothetical protein